MTKRNDKTQSLQFRNCVLKLAEVISMDEIKRLQLLGGLAVIMGRDMPKEAIKIYCSTLSDVPYAQLERACNLWMNKPNSPYFPTPGQLRACLAPTDDELAREAVSRIVLALSKYSDVYSHTPERERKAMEYIGSLGWEIVKRKGGWQKLSRCDNDDIGTTSQAQMRELCISILNHQRLGLQDVRPQLPGAPEFPILQDESKPDQVPHSAAPLKLSELFRAVKPVKEMNELEKKNRIEELRKQSVQLWGKP